MKRFKGNRKYCAWSGAVNYIRNSVLYSYLANLLPVIHCILSEASEIDRFGEIFITIEFS